MPLPRLHGRPARPPGAHAHPPGHRREGAAPGVHGDEPQPQREAVRPQEPAGVLRPRAAAGPGVPSGVRAGAGHAVGAVPRAAAVPGVGRRRAAPGDALHRARRHRPPPAAGPSAGLRLRAARRRRRTRPGVRTRPRLAPPPRPGVADGRGTVRHRARPRDRQTGQELRAALARPDLELHRPAPLT
ncbi:hypothetical protein LV779_21950 [Streptomyces thinghirensis]|nr:hypothetical protein [Streptomyces thinghirensis]